MLGTMASYFPKHTVAWKLEEPPAFRRLTLSVVEMALVTGVVVRLYRALVLTNAPSGWLTFALVVAFGFMLFFGMATAHLANFTIRQWVWRAPLFALLEAVGEMLTSLGLIALGREPSGSGRATFDDWAPMAGDLFAWRLIPLLVYVALLAGVVQVVRYLLLRAEHRDSTFVAIHEETERLEDEREAQERLAQERGS